MFLITYVWVVEGRQSYGQQIHSDPIEFIASCQEYKETFYLINAQPITDEQAKKYDGAFLGM